MFVPRNMSTRLSISCNMSMRPIHVGSSGGRDYFAQHQSRPRIPRKNRKQHATPSQAFASKRFTTRGMEPRKGPFVGHERSRSKVSNSRERDIDRRWEEDVACRGTTNTTRRWTHGSAPLRRVAFGKRAMDSPAGYLGKVKRR